MVQSATYFFLLRIKTYSIVRIASDMFNLEINFKKTNEELLCKIKSRNLFSSAGPL
jgi:hypothetical protein